MKLGDITTEDGWIKTRTGRRVYNRKKHLFTAADIVRLQSKVGPERETSASVARQILKFALELIINVTSFASGQQFPAGLSDKIAEGLVRTFDSSERVNALLDGIDVLIDQRAVLLKKNADLLLENAELRRLISDLSSVTKE